MLFFPIPNEYIVQFVNMYHDYVLKYNSDCHPRWVGLFIRLDKFLTIYTPYTPLSNHSTQLAEWRAFRSGPDS